jgi:hypothetical protein
MRTDITYVILRPEMDVPLGYIRSTGNPSLEAMADHLAVLTGFENRDAMLNANPGLTLGFAPLH